MAIRFDDRSVKMVWQANELFTGNALFAYDVPPHAEVLLSRPEVWDLLGQPDPALGSNYCLSCSPKPITGRAAAQ